MPDLLAVSKGTEAPRSTSIAVLKWFSFAGLIVLLFTAIKLHHFLQGRFDFDDAYMYCRYAYNFRHGWGIAWDPAGPHTFGLTSLPWFYVILIGSYFIHNNATLLTTASCATGLVALFALCVLISSQARSLPLKRPLLLLPYVAFPVLLNARFDQSWSNGMETMLAMFAVVLFLGAHNIYEKKGKPLSLLLLCLAAAFCVLTRPELIILIVTLPITAKILNRAQHVALGWYVALISFMLTVVLLVNKWYFGTPVPLAFHLKAMHGYDGYRLFINPLASTAIFLSIALPFLLLLVSLMRTRHIATLAVFVLPLALEIAYLATVTQIMGSQGRYYVPLLPLVIVPAFLLLDEHLRNREFTSLTHVRLIALVMVLLISREYTQGITLFVGSLAARLHKYYPPPVFLPSHEPQLPIETSWKKFADFAQQLPPGTTMASSEVGILGASAPQVSILDLAGLNNAHLAMHPEDVAYVFSQRPDVIWMPHSDYTKFYGSLASAPQLLEEYNLYDGALNFGLAIRKSSEARPEFTAAIDRGWQIMYPGYRRQDYLVRQVVWDPHKLLRESGANVLDQ